jgi:hypothetical protein
MSIENLLVEIIPPNDYAYRRDFTNHHLIDKLTIDEKILLEDALIKRLNTDRDLLVIKTLAYLKSERSLPALYTILEEETEAMPKLIIASSIFEINGDEHMVQTCISSFRMVDNKYSIIAAFYYLKKLNNAEADNLIREHTDHPEYPVSYNAKRFLGIINP